MRTLIHFVRHAEVENPKNIWYGRLKGFVLSERGKRQAHALADHFAGSELAAVYSSPLERAIQTAEAIASEHGIEVALEPDIIESDTKLQGKYGDARLFRNPLNLRFFINPTRPSWGESYRSIAERMKRAVDHLLDEHAGHEVVAVSHMTPISVARMQVESPGKSMWRRGIICARASVTTLEFNDRSYVRTDYLDLGTGVT